MSREDKVKLLIEIDREKRERFKDKVESEGRKIRWVVERLVDYYMENGMPYDEDEAEKRR